jgi:hypothetical protein
LAGHFALEEFRAGGTVQRQEYEEQKPVLADPEKRKGVTASMRIPNAFQHTCLPFVSNARRVESS